MKRMEKDNVTLANLTGQSIRLEPTRLRRTQSRSTTDFDRVRAQAESLYRVLKKNWCCSCRIPHNASLRLEARTSQPDIESGGMRFRMVFSFDAGHTGNVVPWKPRQTEIEPIEVDGDVDSLVIGVPSGAVSSASLLCPSPSRSSLSYPSHSMFSYCPHAPGTFMNRSCALAFRPSESLNTVQTPPSQISQSPIALQMFKPYDARVLCGIPGRNARFPLSVPS
jgi:hypothetical protein